MRTNEIDGSHREIGILGQRSECGAHLSRQFGGPLVADHPVLELDRQLAARGEYPGEGEVGGVVVVHADDAVGGLEVGEGVVVEEVLQHQQ